MPQDTLTQQERHVLAFNSFEAGSATKDPSWVRSLRKAAISRFSRLGFPVTRRGNEEWKYTDISQIARAPLHPMLTDSPVQLKVDEIERFIFGERDWSRLVFLDGRYDKYLSSVASLPPDVCVSNLAEAMAPKATLLESHLARYADYVANPFTALNTAFLNHGAFVHIKDGTIVEKPIHLVFISTGHTSDTVSHPRVLILVGQDSKATIIQSFGALSNNRYLTNSVTEVVLDAGAAVHYYRVQRESEQAYHIGTTQVVQAHNSSFSSVTADVGGKLVRNNLNVVMDGQGSSCILNGFYIVTDSQHVDNQVMIDHAKPYTTSRELYKGILAGQSRAVFHGSILVRKGAQKVDAQQSDKNLLLSDQAEADTKPAFWIYADDVKCGHGAACGKIDEDALFYLRSRGIEEHDARSILTHSFVTPVVDTIYSEPLRTHIHELVAKKLRHLEKNQDNSRVFSEDSLQ